MQPSAYPEHLQCRIYRASSLLGQQAPASGWGLLGHCWVTKQLKSQQWHSNPLEIMCPLLFLQGWLQAAYQGLLLGRLDCLLASRA